MKDTVEAIQRTWKLSENKVQLNLQTVFTEAAKLICSSGFSTFIRAAVEGYVLNWHHSVHVMNRESSQKTFILKVNLQGNY